MQKEDRKPLVQKYQVLAVLYSTLKNLETKSRFRETQSFEFHIIKQINIFLRGEKVDLGLECCT